MCVSETKRTFFCLLFCNCKLYYKRYVVRLNLGFRCGFVATYRAAFGAFVGDYISLFRVGLSRYRNHKSAAAACSVAGVIIQMKRAKTARTVIAARIAERLNVKSAILAYEFFVFFFKKLCFHRIILCPSARAQARRAPSAPREPERRTWAQRRSVPSGRR